MLIRLLAGLVVAYGVVVLLVFVLQPRLLFLPNLPGRALTATPADIGLRYQTVELVTADGQTLHGWWLPRQSARATLLFFHGNAGNISHRLDSLEIFHDLGLQVLIFDYRGYGQSSGKPSEAGMYHDARAAWRWLTDERRIAPEKIVLFGRSMGGAVASELAAQVAPAALIVESTFSSVPDVAAEIYWWLPVRLLARLQFNAADHIARTTLPVLIVHSRDDEIIPFDNAHRLQKAAGRRATLLEISGSHNTGFIDSRQRYVDGLERFIAEHVDRLE